MAGKMTVIAPTIAPRMKQKIRIAAYCRVSTSSDDQQHSFNAQKLHFMMLYAHSADCELADIYADMGITGTETVIRPEFQRMMDDARCGKIDRVVCKSISRFARNTRDCLIALRELKRLGVTVTFEKEGIDTARVSDEIMITIMEGLAQEEVNSISRNVRWSLKRRMADGTLRIARVPYGYTKDENRNLVIDEKKAAVVRRIYELYLSGSGVRKIAVIFNGEHIPSPTGKLWNNITVKKILKQEKYIGDIRWQKTYSVFMGEKWKINRGEADSFYIENAHPAIIDRETFYLAQQIREEAAEKTKPKSETKKELFQGKIKCTCGRSYYRVKAKTDYWQCIGRSDLAAPCENYIFYTHEIEAAWNRFCTKLRTHADEILTSVLIQLEMMEDAVKGAEIENLQSQADEIRQRRYMLCRLCAENCIDREKFLIAENELDAELEAVTAQIEKVSSFTDDTAEQVEMIYKAVSTMPPESLVNTILDHAAVDGKIITFYLTGGLYFREEI